jgi:hypothetical protein
MSASVSASGSMLNTVSPKNFTEFFITIMYMPTATFEPGKRPKISSGGRTVSG